MMKSRTLLILVFALMMGSGAAWMADRWIQQRLVPARTGEIKTTAIVVAALDIPFGQKIESAHLRFIEWPDKTPLPKGALFSAEDIQGKVANQQIFEGEFILNSRIVKHISGSTLSAIIEPNMRAITLRVNDVVGVAGFLLPGNRVDVLNSRKIQKRVITNIILENIKVLAVDQTASPNKDKPLVVRAVTLEVFPKQAKKLFKATEEGKIQLVLRNPLDDSIAIKTLVESKVIAVKAPVVKKKTQAVKQRSYRSVTVIRGTNINISRVK